ncbi:hypothetical protein HMPREF0620_1602 [Parascardovia denticolens DSM 10105 = JCM 12538]|uniref:Uncharacterized protein n=1 Tax=Parascardovia denticolens DSM 10105 = JCM 12538 TaxID=864564 RepID=E6K2C9_PARDN|nr:hypothetical protein HMPREF0620_1602 [Parascardovia denticolens DSM 10105 = JCM 12538]BAR04607.1 hypothetical protein PSDT_0088 [Parascardovia denticolens DSM 10105 = JCM 12538]
MPPGGAEILSGKRRAPVGLSMRRLRELASDQQGPHPADPAIQGPDSRLHLGREATQPQKRVQAPQTVAVGRR